MTYETDTEHVETCRKSLAECPACADHYGLVSYKLGDE